MPVTKYKNGNKKGWLIDSSRTVNRKTRRTREVFYGPRLEADKRLAEMHDKLNRKHVTGSFESLAAAYVEWASERLSSWPKISWVIPRLVKAFGPYPIAEIGLDEISEYQQSRLSEFRQRPPVRTKDDHGSFVLQPSSFTGSKVSPATVNREIGILSSIFTYGIKSGRIRPPVNPCLFVDKLPVAVTMENVITDDDLVKLCDGRAYHVIRAFLIARYTGLRHSHILKLDWSQIRGGIIYPAGAQSRKRVGRVPVRDGLWLALGERKESGPVLTCGNYGLRYDDDGKRVIDVPGVSLKKPIQRAAKALGRPFRIHDLRAAFFTELVLSGIPDMIRSVMMGHGRDMALSPTLAERYSRISDAALISAMKSLPDCQNIVNRCLKLTK